MMEIIYTASLNEDFRRLNEMLDENYFERFGESSLQYRPYNSLNGVCDFFTGYDGDKAVACGCIKQFSEDAAELKRVFVLADYRRKHLAYEVVKRCEDRAREKGFRYMVLETGKEMPEAIALYQKSGYVLIDNFPPFVGDEVCVCMRKEL